MSESFIEEAKNFRRQMKWSSIISWIATLVFLFNYNDTPNLQEDLSWVIIPIGAVILTIIYFSMDSNIKQYEKLTKNK
jgi:amino acid transporter